MGGPIYWETFDSPGQGGRLGGVGNGEDGEAEDADNYRS